MLGSYYNMELWAAVRLAANNLDRSKGVGKPWLIIYLHLQFFFHYPIIINTAAILDWHWKPLYEEL